MFEEKTFTSLPKYLTHAVMFLHDLSKNLNIIS
jgi:hypothetical protein